MGAFIKFIAIAVRRIATKVAQSFVTKTANRVAKYSSFSKTKRIRLINLPHKKVNLDMRVSTPKMRNKKFKQISNSLKEKIENATNIKFPKPKSIDKRKLNDIQFSLEIGGNKKVWGYKKKNPNEIKVDEYLKQIEEKFPIAKKSKLSKLIKKFTPAKIKKIQRLIKLISQSEKLTKEFNEIAGEDSQDEPGVVVGLESSWMEWGIYEPIPYKKGWGNLTLKIRSVNTKTGERIKSAKNPSLIYNFGIGELRPPIAYWMWQDVIKSANAGTTFWDTYFYESRVVGTKIDIANKKQTYTREQYYQANK